MQIFVWVNLTSIEQFFHFHFFMFDSKTKYSKENEKVIIFDLIKFCAHTFFYR